MSNLPIKTDLSELNEEQRKAVTSDRAKLCRITEKGNESPFLSEIPEIYTIKTGEPLKASAEPVRMCPRCYSKLERMWVVCPWCGEGVS